MEDTLQHRPSALAALDNQVASCKQRKMDERDVACLKQVLTRDVEVIDQEISKLNRRRNALKPVGRLPPELLTMIFLAYLASPWPTHLHQTPALASFFSEVSKRRAILLQVCQYWRAAVFQTAILWAWIYPTELGELELALKRSDPYPLVVFDSNIAHSGAWARLLTELPRMRALQLCLNDDIDQLLTSLEPSILNAPLLEDLTLTARSSHHTISPIPRFPDMELPGLTSLTLISVTPYEVETLVRPTLTSLTLSVIIPEESLPSLVAALNEVPALEVLCIDLDIMWDDSDEEHEPITLPRLKSLSLYGSRWASGSDMAWFLTLFSPPPKTLNKFKFIPIFDRVAYDDLTTPCLATHCPMVSVLANLRSSSPMGSDENKIQPRTLVWIDHHRFHPIHRTDVKINIWSAELDLDKSNLSEPEESAHSRSFHGEILWQANLFCGGDFIERPPVQEHLDLSLVTTLDISTGIRGVSYWRKFFATMPSVETLIVRQMVSTKDYTKDVMLVLKDIFRAFALPPPSIGETETLSPVLPALKTLCICGTDRFVISFSDQTTLLDTSSDPSLIIRLVDDLRKSLHSRLAVFSRLRLLKFVDVKGIETYWAGSIAHARQADIVEANGKRCTLPAASVRRALTIT